MFSNRTVLITAVTRWGWIGVRIILDLIPDYLHSCDRPLEKWWGRGVDIFFSLHENFCSDRLLCRNLFARIILLYRPFFCYFALHEFFGGIPPPQPPITFIIVSLIHWASPGRSGFALQCWPTFCVANFSFCCLTGGRWAHPALLCAMADWTVKQLKEGNLCSNWMTYLKCLPSADWFRFDDTVR